MIKHAREGAISWLPDVCASDIPSPLPKAITIHLRGGVLGIEAQGVVGAIPLLNGDTLQILPKIDRVNFFRLLLRAEGIQPEVEREYNNFVAYSVEEEANIDSLVARHLIFSASEILKRSPQVGRVRRRRRGAFAVGQLDVVETTLNLVLRAENPVAYFIRERTVDIPENRVLTEAINRAWAVLSASDREAFRQVRERWCTRFPASDDLNDDLEHIEQNFASGRYGGPRDYYRRALMLAQIVLGNNGLGLCDGEIVNGDAVLLNTADIFEKYIRNVIGDACSASEYVVTKSFVGDTSLYTDGSFKLEPDITISKGGRVVLLADAKYKKPSGPDHYQMQTYLRISGLKRGILLSPSYEGDTVMLRDYITADKIVVTEAYLPMRNLAVTEGFLRTVIRFAQRVTH